MSASNDPLRVGGGLSIDIDAETAALAAADDAAAGLDGRSPALVTVFAADDHRDSIDDVAAVLRARFPDAALVGCAGQGIIGGSQELEEGPAIAVLAAAMPGTTVTPFALEFDEAEATYRGWPADLAADATVLLFADPYSFPVAHFVTDTDQRLPGLRIVGGVASGVHRAGDARLVAGDEVRTSGAVAVAVSGRVRLQPLVSQGCKPIGTPAIITRADRNIIFELAGERPIDRIRAMWSAADAHERALMQGGLFIGRVVDEYKTDFGRGDFLIRNVAGADPESGFLAVADIVNVGETVQFHVRDPDSADEDLRLLVSSVPERVGGALLFACNGRGTNMFPKPGHDAEVVHDGFGHVPVAGFFANGELGPVGGRNFWHSFTASMALFVDSEG